MFLRLFFQVAQFSSFVFQVPAFLEGYIITEILRQFFNTLEI